jgi:hypothetical protein
MNGVAYWKPIAGAAHFGNNDPAPVNLGRSADLGRSRAFLGLEKVSSDGSGGGGSSTTRAMQVTFFSRSMIIMLLIVLTAGNPFGRSELVQVPLRETCSDVCTRSVVAVPQDLPSSSRLEHYQRLGPATRVISSSDGKVTINASVSNVAVMVSIEGGVSNRCSPSGGSLSSNRAGVAFDMGGWVHKMCRDGPNFSCGACNGGHWYPKAITFVEWMSDQFTHMGFQLLPKLSFTCKWMALHSDVIILVASAKQAEFMQLACGQIGRLQIAAERFVIHPMDKPVIATLLYYPLFTNEYSDEQLWCKGHKCTPMPNVGMRLGMTGGPGMMQPLQVSTAPDTGTRIARIRNKVVYLPRKPHHARHVENQDEMVKLVCAALESTQKDSNLDPLQGGQPLELSVYKLSNNFSQDAVFLQDARAIISAHGGGLGNLIFAPPETLVVELNNVSHANLCFVGLCNMLNFAYEAVTPEKYGHGAPEMVINPACVVAALAKHLPQLHSLNSSSNAGSPGTKCMKLAQEIEHMFN